MPTKKPEPAGDLLARYEEISNQLVPAWKAKHAALDRYNAAAARASEIEREMFNLMYQLHPSSSFSSTAARDVLERELAAAGITAKGAAR